LRRVAFGRAKGDDVSASASLCAVICLFGACCSAVAAPEACADVRAAIEKRMRARGAAPAVLQIVPRSLTAGGRVVGSCENGTQKIVQRSAADASPAAGSSKPVRQPSP
jgi:hypothetical protein